MATASWKLVLQLGEGHEYPGPLMTLEICPCRYCKCGKNGPKSQKLPYLSDFLPSEIVDFLSIGCGDSSTLSTSSVATETQNRSLGLENTKEDQPSGDIHEPPGPVANDRNQQGGNADDSSRAQNRKSSTTPELVTSSAVSSGLDAVGVATTNSSELASSKTSVPFGNSRSSRSSSSHRPSLYLSRQRLSINSTCSDFDLRRNLPFLQSSFLIRKAAATFKCKKCPKTYVKRGNLKIHMKLHLGIRQFRCNKGSCRRQFISRPGLLTHIRIGHAEDSSLRDSQLSNSRNLQETHGSGTPDSDETMHQPDLELVHSQPRDPNYCPPESAEHHDVESGASPTGEDFVIVADTLSQLEPGGSGSNDHPGSTVVVEESVEVSTMNESCNSRFHPTLCRHHGSQPGSSLREAPSESTDFVGESSHSASEPCGSHHHFSNCRHGDLTDTEDTIIDSKGDKENGTEDGSTGSDSETGAGELEEDSDENSAGFPAPNGVLSIAAEGNIDVLENPNFKAKDLLRGVRKVGRHNNRGNSVPLPPEIMSDTDDQYLQEMETRDEDVSVAVSTPADGNNTADERINGQHQETKVQSNDQQTNDSNVSISLAITSSFVGRPTSEASDGFRDRENSAQSKLIEQASALESADFSDSEEYDAQLSDSDNDASTEESSDREDTSASLQTRSSFRQTSPQQSSSELENSISSTALKSNSQPSTTSQDPEGQSKCLQFNMRDNKTTTRLEGGEEFPEAAAANVLRSPVPPEAHHTEAPTANSSTPSLQAADVLPQPTETPLRSTRTRELTSSSPIADCRDPEEHVLQDVFQPDVGPSEPSPKPERRESLRISQKINSSSVQEETSESGDDDINTAAASSRELSDINDEEENLPDDDEVRELRSRQSEGLKRNPENLTRGEKPRKRKRLCLECGKQYEGRAALNLHLREHDSVEPFECGLCANRFETRKKYVFHVNKSHKDQAGRFKCNQCEYYTKWPRLIIQHLGVHSGERPYKCDQCTASFKSSSHLTVHKLYHSGERPYKCDQCTESFTQSGHLTTHKRFHSGKRPHHCNKWTKRYTRKLPLRHHQTTEHTKKKVKQ